MATNSTQLQKPTRRLELWTTPWLVGQVVYYSCFHPPALILDMRRGVYGCALADVDVDERAQVQALIVKELWATPPLTTGTTPRTPLGTCQV